MRNSSPVERIIRLSLEIAVPALLCHPSFDGTHFSKNILISRQASNPQFDHACYMLTESYINALLVDEELAELVWEAWDQQLIDEEEARLAWLSVVTINW